LIRAGLRDPVLVSVREKTIPKSPNDDTRGGQVPSSTPSALNNHFLIVDPPEDKLAALLSFLRKLPSGTKAMLFISTCAAVEYIALVLERLLRDSINVMSIHGKKAKRGKDFDKFRKAKSGKIIFSLDALINLM